MSAGHGNLVTHILSEHCDWFETRKNGDPDIPMSEFLTKNTHIYSWLDWIFSDMHYFNFVDKELIKKYTKLESISSKTLISYAEKLAGKIENKI